MDSNDSVVKKQQAELLELRMVLGNAQRFFAEVSPSFVLTPLFDLEFFRASL
jgi:hypothetical protein